jgi:hypothetical protein
MMLRALLVLAGLLATAGCASTRGAAGGTLPFKVAVIPFDAAALPDGRGSEGTAAAAADEGDTIAPRFDPARLADAVRDALRDRFADAVVLPWPAGTSIEEFQKRSRAEQDEWWRRACAAADADLVLECDAKVPRRATYGANEAFWLNLPLFLIGGPFCWFVDDTSYHGEARLEAVLHQVLPIAGGRATLADGDAEVARFEVRLDEVRMDFLDRGEPLGYVLSFVIPPGLLDRNNAHVEEHFARALGDGLAAGLARRVDESAGTILASESLADFYLLRDVRAVASGGAVVVTGAVEVRSESAGEMRGCVVHCGDRSVDGTLAEARPDPARSSERAPRSRIAFSATVPRGQGADRVRIELTQGGRDPIGRTFTVLIDASGSVVESPTEAAPATASAAPIRTSG